MTEPKKTALGKGLSALIKKNSTTISNPTEEREGYIPQLDIEQIEPNRYQPRSELKPEALVELTDSIRHHGIIEPIIVTKSENGGFELIAGERRWRAAQLAGLSFVPAVVKEATPQEMLEIAIIENIQREDLNALEEAMAFDQLVSEFEMSHEQISIKVGLSRSAIANKIRLLTLPSEIKKGLLDNKLSEGHARALLGLKTTETMIATYKIILRDSLSVRAVEELVRRLNKGVNKTRKSSNLILDEKTIEIEQNLKQIFGSAVRLTRSTKGGKIVLPFANDDELDRITRLIT